jgi:RNA polymerase sigma-70 factor (ECF subfamily)
VGGPTYDEVADDREPTATADPCPQPAEGQLEVEDRMLAAAGDDPEAFGDFYTLTCGDLTRWFAARAIDREIVADLVAETYAELLSARRRYSTRRGHARQFLWGIAHHQLRHWQRRGFVERRWRARSAIVFEPTATDLYGDADHRIDDRLGVVLVRTALAALGPDDRRALVLRIGHQLDYDRVAAELGCSAGAARVRVSRALAKLSAEFTDRLGEEPG